MKIKLVTTTDQPEHEGCKQLVRSLEKFGWDYELLNGYYEAYGSKQIAFHKYVKEHPEYSHFFLVDAHDIVVLGGIGEVMWSLYDWKESVVFNAEKGLYPYPDKWRDIYPTKNIESRWKYLNGGAAFVERERYIALLDEFPILHTDNDQANFTEMYLNEEIRNKYNITLDTECKVFQSIAFQSEDEFKILRDGIYNKLTETFPLIIHGNGKTNMDWVYNLIK